MGSGVGEGLSDGSDVGEGLSDGEGVSVGVGEGLTIEEGVGVSCAKIAFGKVRQERATNPIMTSTKVK